MCPRPLLAVLLWFATGPVFAHPPPSFLVSADAPYQDNELPGLTRLYHAAGDVTFLAHLGDLKSGTSSCGDDAYAAVRDMFRGLSLPMVFSPGDNDWTDCRRLVAGDFDPNERLATLRRVMFGDPAVLRLNALHVRRPPALAEQYPELFWFRYGHVLFINWHVVGSDNNRLSDDPAALAEYQARSAANAALTDAALKGFKGYLRAVVIMTHAGLALGQHLPPRGFRPAHRLLTEVLARTRAPVLLIHGDDHVYRTDQPWAGRPDGDRLWRLALPGHPAVAGVKVSFTQDKRAPFHFDYRDAAPSPAASVNRRTSKPRRPG